MGDRETGVGERKNERERVRDGRKTEWQECAREKGVRERERDRSERKGERQGCKRKIKRDSGWEIVERISCHFWPNCALFDKSTKIGTEVV